MTTTARALLLCLMLAPLAARAEDAPDELAPTVGAALERTEVLIGDRVRLTISATARSGVTVTLPPHKGKLGKLDVADNAPIDSPDKSDKANAEERERDKNGRDLGDGRRAFRFVLDVSAYEVGELEVPAVELRYTRPDGEVRSVKTKPLNLTVRGLIQGDDAELQPLRPVRTAMVKDERVYWTLAWVGPIFAGLLLVGILWLVVPRRLRKRRARAEAARPEAARRPADEVAIEKLAALEAAGDFARDGYRPFYFAAAEIVREFLGARFGFDALEMTSEELLEALRDKAPRLLSPTVEDGVERASDVARFVEESDLVKFARTGSTDAAARGVLAAARALVLANARKLEEAASMVRDPVRPAPMNGADRDRP